MKDFILVRVDETSNIFLICEKNPRIPTTRGLPLVVHGLLKVEGDCYEEAYYSYKAISDEFIMEDLARYGKKAIEIYFEKN